MTRAGLGIAGSILVAGGLLAGFDGFRTRLALDAARRQNTALRARQEALGERADGLAARLVEAVDCRRRIVRLAGSTSRAWEDESLRLPASEIRNEAILALLSAR